MRKIFLFTLAFIIALGSILPVGLTLEVGASSARIYEQRTFALEGKGNTDRFSQYQTKRPWSKFEPTGIYVRQNEQIKLTVNGTGLAKAYIQVPQYGNTWNANKQNLNQGTNSIKSPINGVLYLANEETKGSVSVTVEGGTHFPVFEKNAHKDQDFDAMMKKYSNAQYVEFVSDRALITVPRSDAAKYTKKPSELLKKFDIALEAQYKLAAYDIYADDVPHQQEKHYIHYTKSGPYNNFAAVAFNYYTCFVNEYVEAILNADYIHQYLAWHETGHLVQQRAWNFTNMTEVQVSLYERISQVALGQKLSYDYTEIFDYLYRQTVTYDNIPNPSYSALKIGMLWQLYLGLGENFYPKLHQLVRELPLTEQNLPLAEKKQLFMVMSCKAAGRNLLPFFDKWRLEPSQKTRNEIAKLNLPKLAAPIWESTDALPVKENVNIVVEFNKPQNTPKPIAPTNVKATNITSNSVTLSWDNQEGIKNYLVYRNGTLIASTTVNNFTNNNLSEDTSYTYEIIVVSTRDVASNKSNPLQIKTSKAVSALPTRPSSLAAKNVTTSSLELTWSASTHAKGIAKYIVYRDGVAINEVSSNKFTDSNLQANSAYTYTVKAVSNDNVTSNASDALKVTTKNVTPTKPNAPVSLRTTNVTTSAVELTWGAVSHSSGVAKYIVYRDGKVVAEVLSNKYLDSNLNANTVYTYTVKAVSNDNISSDMSGALNVTTKNNASSGNVRQWKVNESYTAGELVKHNGKTYRVLNSHTNHGDPNWAPGIANSLFTQVQ